MSHTFIVTLQMKDPSFEDEKGRFYPGDLETISQSIWHCDSANCDHRESLCAICINDWASEYIGFIFMDNFFCGDVRMAVAVELDTMADVIQHHPPK